MKNMFRLLVLVALVIGAWVFSAVLPDIMRYLKMRQM